MTVDDRQARPRRFRVSLQLAVSLLLIGTVVAVGVAVGIYDYVRRRGSCSRPRTTYSAGSGWVACSPPHTMRRAPRSRDPGVFTVYSR